MLLNAHFVRIFLNYIMFHRTPTMYKNKFYVLHSYIRTYSYNTTLFYFFLLAFYSRRSYLAEKKNRNNQTNEIRSCPGEHIAVCECMHILTRVRLLVHVCIVCECLFAVHSPFTFA